MFSALGWAAFCPSAQHIFLSLDWKWWINLHLTAPCVTFPRSPDVTQSTEVGIQQVLCLFWCFKWASEDRESEASEVPAALPPACPPRFSLCSLGSRGEAHKLRVHPESCWHSLLTAVEICKYGGRLWVVCPFKHNLIIEPRILKYQPTITDTWCQLTAADSWNVSAVCLWSDKEGWTFCCCGSSQWESSYLKHITPDVFRPSIKWQLLKSQIKQMIHPFMWKVAWLKRWSWRAALILSKKTDPRYRTLLLGGVPEPWAITQDCGGAPSHSSWSSARPKVLQQFEG